MADSKSESMSWIELVVTKSSKNRVFNFTNISLVVLGSILLIISAKIKVDLYPVPMTLQPLAVLMIGMLYGRSLAISTIGLYIFQGAIGFPVFAYGGGLLYLFGPTGGFILGFLVSGLVLGHLADKGWGRNIFTSLICMMIGLVVIYSFGILQLSVIKGFEYALIKGFYPFLVGDLYKLMIAGLLVPFIWRFAK